MAYQRRGIGADPGVNVTTIWTPQTGFNVSGGGGGGAAYVAPAVIANPACLQDTSPGGTAFSDACQTQLRQVQQQRMQLANNANYNVDLANCLNTFPQPPDCYTRTFGLTPTGGYTSDASVQGKQGQVIVDASGNVVSNPPPVYSATGTPNIFVAPIPHAIIPAPAPPPGGTPLPTSPAPPGPTTTADGGSTTSGGGYVAPGTDFITSDVNLAGFNIPVWGLLAAGAATLFFLGGRH